MIVYGNTECHACSMSNCSMKVEDKFSAISIHIRGSDQVRSQGLMVREGGFRVKKL